MNLLKKPYGLTLQALLWVMIFGCLLAHPFTNATSSPPGDKREYVLIINSYNESSSWSWEIITDITARIEQIENLEVYVEHMNMLLMDQQSDLDNFRANLAREYGKNPPRMLIYIGAPAFTMRDFAEKEWGKGIPSIICAEEDFIGPDKYYVSKQAIPHSERIPLRKLNGEYNLTLLYAPIYLEQTIELMRRMIPEMNRLVFVRDGRYINQQYEEELSKLLQTDYPGMRFTSYKASNMSVDQLLDSLNVTDTRHTGVLFSSWHYTRNIAGNTEITANPFKIIASSTAPLFALWPPSVKKQRRGRRIHIRYGRVQPAGHRNVRHHSGGTPAARHSVLCPIRRPPDVQLPGDAAQQDFTRNMPLGFGIHRQAGDIHGAEQNGDHPMRRPFPAFHPLPAMAHPRHAQSRSSPPAGIGKPDKIRESVQPNADHLHSGTRDLRP